jgi:hypothetical protein
MPREKKKAVTVITSCTHLPLSEGYRQEVTQMGKEMGVLQNKIFKALA